MIRRVLLFFAFLSAASANQRVTIFCMQGGHFVVTNGVPSVTQVQQSYPVCTMTVYPAGSNTPVAGSSIFADNVGTVKGNPFNADQTGVGFFYAANGRYDVVISGGQGGGLPAPYTIGDILLQDNAAGGTITSVTGSSGVSCNTVVGAVTCTNSGVTSNVAGSGIGVSAATGAVTITNNGVTGATAGTGIGVSGATGNVTFSNTGVTSVAAGTGISLTGSTGAVTISATGGGGASVGQGPLTWTQTPSGSLSVGANTVTLTPCPQGLNGSDSNHPVYITGPGGPTSIAISSVRPDTTPYQVNTVSAHGLSTGNFVNILCTTVTNSVCGPWQITSTGANSFTLQNSIPVFGFALAYATNASPIVVDWNQRPGLATGDTLTISGVTGNTGANGTFTYTRINDYQGQLQGSTGTGTFTGGSQTITFGAGSPSLGGTATASFGPEAANITGGSCTSGAGSGTITLSLLNAHSSGYTIGSATAGIQEGIVAAQAGGITSILVPSGTQSMQANATLPTGFKISGASDLSSVLQLNPPGTPAIALINAAGTAASSTVSTTTVSYATRATASTRSLTLTSVAGISAGTYLDFLSGADPTYGNVYEEVEVVDSVTGSVVNLKAPLVIPVIAAINTVTPFTPVSIAVSNLTLDGKSTGGDRPVSFSMVGIQCVYCTQSTFRNLKLINWTGGGGLYVNFGDQIQVDGINVVNSGNQNYNDIGLARVTRGNLANIISQNSFGFGPGWYSAIKSNGVNIATNDPFSRAFKTSECVDSNFSNLSLHGGVHATGLSITNGSYNCNYNNIIAEGMQNVQGVWFSNLDEQWNKVTNVKAYNNSFFGGSNTDIQLFGNDSNNFLSGLDMGSGLSDNGTNNTWSVAIPARSRASETAAENLTSGAFTDLTFDTNNYDVGPVHSTSVNTNRFTIPVAQGGFSGGVCQIWHITGQVLVAANNTGIRGAQIAKNGGGAIILGETVNNVGGSNATPAYVTGTAQLCDGDYVTLQGFQNSGGNLSVAGSYMEIRRAW